MKLLGKKGNTLALSGIITCFLQLGASAESMERIDGVYFFGYDGFDLNEIKTKFSLKSGAEIDRDQFFPKKYELYKDEIKAIVGKAATDVALVSFNKGTIVFVGIPGKSNSEQPKLLKIGTERLAVSKKIAATYDQLMQLVVILVRTQKQEDKDAYKSKKTELEKLATVEKASLRKALDSSLVQDRVVASYALGLVASTKEELLALAERSNDPDSTVRNNSTRELAELLESKPELANQIPASNFVAMLKSPTWTDRNKAVYILHGLTKSRNAEILAEMRKTAIPALKEMCERLAVIARAQLTC